MTWRVSPSILGQPGLTRNCEPWRNKQSRNSWQMSDTSGKEHIKLHKFPAHHWLKKHEISEACSRSWNQRSMFPVNNTNTRSRYIDTCSATLRNAIFGSRPYNETMRSQQLKPSQMQSPGCFFTETKAQPSRLSRTSDSVHHGLITSYHREKHTFFEQKH